MKLQFLENKIIGHITLTRSKAKLNVYLYDDNLVFCFYDSIFESGWELSEFKKITLYKDNKYIRDEVLKFERDFNLIKLLDGE